MGNAKYHRGRRWEYAVSRARKKLGHLVTRSAGSKGFWDLTEVQNDGTVWLIQCKATDEPSGSGWKDENWFTLVRLSKTWTTGTMPVAFVKRSRGATEIHGPHGRIE
jgi:hypothetical protein